MPPGGKFVSGLVRTRMTRGAATGSRFWTVVAAVSTTRAILKRLQGKDEVVFRKTLRRGDTLVITTQSEGVSVQGPGTGNMET
jgi:hypothetical protein